MTHVIATGCLKGRDLCSRDILQDCPIHQRFCGKSLESVESPAMSLVCWQFVPFWRPVFMLNRKLFLLYRQEFREGEEIQM